MRFVYLSDSVLGKLMKGRTEPVGHSTGIQRTNVVLALTCFMKTIIKKNITFIYCYKLLTWVTSHYCHNYTWIHLIIQHKFCIMKVTFLILIKSVNEYIWHEKFHLTHNSVGG